MRHYPFAIVVCNYFLKPPSSISLIHLNKREKILRCYIIKKHFVRIIKNNCIFYRSHLQLLRFPFSRIPTLPISLGRVNFSLSASLVIYM